MNDKDIKKSSSLYSKTKQPWEEELPKDAYDYLAQVTNTIETTGIII